MYSWDILYSYDELDTQQYCPGEGVTVLLVCESRFEVFLSLL